MDFYLHLNLFYGTRLVSYSLGLYLQHTRPSSLRSPRHLVSFLMHSNFFETLEFHFQGIWISFSYFDFPFETLENSFAHSNLLKSPPKANLRVRRKSPRRVNRPIGHKSSRKGNCPVEHKSPHRVIVL